MSKDLIQVLTAIKATLEEANQSGVITDTIWHGPGETLWDFIDNQIDRHRSSVESVEMPEADIACAVDDCDLICDWSKSHLTPGVHYLYTASTVRSLIAAAVERERDSDVAAELERIAGEAPISGNQLAQARVLMAAAAIRSRGEMK